MNKRQREAAHKALVKLTGNGIMPVKILAAVDPVKKEFLIRLEHGDGVQYLRQVTIHDISDICDAIHALSPFK